VTVINCASRLEALHRSGLLDSPPEESFDRLTRLASVLLQAPIAVVSLVDRDRQYFKSCVGLPEPVGSTRCMPLEYSFCQHAIASHGPLVIDDTRQHPLVRGNPAIREYGMLAYAGIPLVTADGHALGTLCVLDTAPRDWTAREVSSLTDLAGAAMTEISLRLELAERERSDRERAELQRALAVERDRLGTLFEQAPAFIAWARGTDHIFEGANQAYYQLVGFRDIIGKPVAEAVPEAAEHGLIAALDHVLETGEPFVADGMRLLLQRTAGAEPEERFANFVYQALVEADGTRSGIFCHGVDVTEQVRASAAVGESDAHLRRVLDSIPMIVYRAEPTPPYAATYVNAAVESLGYSREEWLSRVDLWQRSLHPDDRARVLRHAHESVTRGEPMDCQYRMVAKDGSTRWIHDRGELVPDERAERCVWQGIMLDITAQREAEVALRESEARHRLIFDEAGIGMAVCDLVGRIEQANAALCEFLGYGHTELVGMRYQAVTHPDDLTLDRKETDELLAGRMSRFTRERRYLRKDGSVVWGLLTVSLLRDAEGAPARRISQVQDITEQKRAEGALRESEARTRSLLETAHEGVWLIDQVGMTVYGNARLGDMLGYAAHELIGTSIFDFMTPEMAFEARTLFARRQRGMSEVQEFALRRRDGGELFVLMSTSPRLSADGEFIGALTMVTDITERRRAEQALRESEARYRHVVTNAPGMVYQFIYRADGTKGYTFVSEGARAIFGVEPEAVVRDATVLLDLVHPEDRAHLVAKAREVAEVAGDFRWEGRIVLPSGEERFIQVVAHDQRMPDGSVVSDGLSLDVTEQRRAVQALEQSEVRFRLAARATNDVVYDWNIPTDEHFWGETLLSSFGYDPRLFVPTLEWWTALIHPDDASRVTSGLMAALGGGAESWSEEYRFRRNDGTYARILDRSYVLRDDTGRAVRLVGSMIDLTEHQLLEEQLRQSQKMEAVGRLAGGVAHDFNNLITVIKASTEFLLADMDAVDARCDDVRQIAAAADRAAGLTRQLLAFSRKQILNPRVLVVNGVVENLKPMLARLIGEHIVVESRLSEAIGSIMADVGQLEQVLINLAVNARDAMPEGGRILIETAQVTLDGAYAAGHAGQERTVVLPGEYIMLAVSDTGTGMPREVQARIFEPFYTTKEAGKGTGLGLSTVYGIVKQSGGHVWVYSEPGHGTVFKLYFPRVASAAATPLGQNVIAPPSGGSETILLVEDEDALRQLARRILERHGYRVLESRNGREALERVTQYEGPIHLVLTDVIMPEMSGRGLVERLRAIRPHAAVVYMSGYTDDDVLRRGLFEHGSRFVQKPFLPQELLRMVREVLEPRSDR
jgi:two-component system cell cycle sensor histidine kinase/response regulator CckA